MNVFSIQVGRRTRSGSFQVQYSRVVSVADSITQAEVFGYFQSRYEGFELEIEEIKDITEYLIEKKTCMQKGRLSDFRIRYTDEEKAIYKEYEKLMETAENTKGKLHRMIEDRYSKLSYVEGGISLKTSHTYPACGTFCTDLKVRSSQFFNVIKNGVEEISDTGFGEELEIQDSPVSKYEEDTDIPF